MDRESDATEDPVHDRDTSEQESDEKRPIGKPQMHTD